MMPTTKTQWIATYFFFKKYHFLLVVFHVESLEENGCLRVKVPKKMVDICKITFETLTQVFCFF